MNIRINSQPRSLSEALKSSNEKRLKSISGEDKSVPTVIDIHKKELVNKGYRDLQHWLENSNHIYIGRNMSFYVPGADKSKWANPFSTKKYGREGCIQEYEEYIRNSNLINQLGELEGKVLGCWCAPKPCHGDILIKLFQEMIIV